MPPPGPHPYPGDATEGSAPLPGPAGAEPGAARQDVAAEIRTGTAVALAVGVSGVLLGLLWLWFAPRLPLVSDGRAIYPADGEGEQAIGMDGWFTLLAAGFGVVSAAVVFGLRRRGGVAVVVGLAAGSLLAALVAWRLGVLLGPGQDIRARAREVGAGKVFDHPLELRAKAALLVWPILAMATHLLLTAAFGPRDPQPRPPAPWPPPHPQPPADQPSADQPPPPPAGTPPAGPLPGPPPKDAPRGPTGH
ncbi:hypothetical protein GCM10027168_46430 [Streptomyces capparidis]